MNKYLSEKLTAISFLLMGMVVFLHSYNLIITFNYGTKIIHNGYNSYIQNFISQGIARVAVPMFFLISGYLFFFNIKSFTFSEYIIKIKKRFETLLLPYVIWSLLGILIYFTLQSFPLSRFFFTKHLIVDNSIPQLLSKLFINPIPYQLWFIRDLIILIIFSPILYWLFKKTNYLLILFFIIMWSFNFSFIIFSSEALLFFSAGSFFSIKRINLQNDWVKKNHFVLLIIWMSLLLIKTYFTNIGFEKSWYTLLLHKFSILIGILSVWSSYDLLFQKKLNSYVKIRPFFQYSFFLYAFHEPLLTILKKVSYSLFGISDVSSIIIYFCVPIITIFICILIGVIMKKVTPKVYFLLTGGR